jgi:hypothetical protein
MRSHRALLVPLLAFALAGCDSSEDGGLTASYFVGTWTLVGVSDDSGDRTSEVEQVLDDLTIDFEAGGQFAMAIDYSAAVNNSGTPDETITGNYDVSSSGDLVMTPSADVGVAFDVDTEGNSRADLSAPAAIINQLLNGSAVNLVFVGTAVLTIERS